MKRTVCVAAAVFCLLLPAAAQEWARASLEKSPRHQEWVAVKHGERTVHAFVVYPESKQKAPAVVVIHENQGLTDWARSLADQLAAAGYIAIAPDLLSGKAPGGGKTSDFPSGDAAREAIGALDPEQVTADLNAVTDYVRKLPAASGKVAVAGFCWGGRQSFRFATSRGDQLRRLSSTVPRRRVWLRAWLGALLRFGRRCSASMRKTTRASMRRWAPRRRR
jgi:carboxymethylenebutenolidase